MIGFALHWDGQERGVLWITGDTVLYDGVLQVADRLQVDTALVHLGGRPLPGVRAGPLHDDGEGCLRVVPPRRAAYRPPDPLGGWKHFAEGRQAIEREFASALEDIRRRVRRLPLGVEVELAA